MEESFSWYENQSPGLVADFLRDVEAALSAVEESRIAGRRSPDPSDDIFFIVFRMVCSTGRKAT